MMQITPLGYWLIPTIVLTLLFKPDYLLYETVLLAPLQAASVINISSITFGLQPAYLSGSLWMAVTLYRYLREKTLILASSDVANFLRLLWIFVLWAAGSALILPSLFTGKLQVLTPEGNLVWLAPTRLNLTQTLYLVWGALLATLITINASKHDVMKVFLLSISAGVITVIFGFYQIFAALFHWPIFEMFLFNNNGFAQGFGQVVGPIKRVSSFLTEPSVYASYLSGVAALVLTMHFREGREQKFPFILPTFILGTLVITGLLLSTSTTAFLLVIIGLLWILASSGFKRSTVYALATLLLTSLLITTFIWGLDVLVRTQERIRQEQLVLKPSPTTSPAIQRAPAPGDVLRISGNIIGSLTIKRVKPPLLMKEVLGIVWP